MKIRKTILAYFSIIMLFIGCSETKDLEINLCNECVIVNKTVYNSTNTANYSITAVSVSGDLLTINISASGCSGNSWNATLVDANSIAESFPIQRNIKISLENNEACLAVITKDFTFNIKELKENESTIILNLEGWNEQIIYN
jgi:hypothetical protein